MTPGMRANAHIPMVLIGPPPCGKRRKAHDRLETRNVNAGAEKEGRLKVVDDLIVSLENDCGLYGLMPNEFKKR